MWSSVQKTVVLIHIILALADFLPQIREAACSLAPCSPTQTWTVTSCPARHQVQPALLQC